jgi:hypothetical protein
VQVGTEHRHGRRHLAQDGLQVERALDRAREIRDLAQPGRRRSQVVASWSAEDAGTIADAGASLATGTGQVKR